MNRNVTNCWSVFWAFVGEACQISNVGQCLFSTDLWNLVFILSMFKDMDKQMLTQLKHENHEKPLFSVTSGCIWLLIIERWQPEKPFLLVLSIIELRPLLLEQGISLLWYGTCSFILQEVVGRCILNWGRGVCMNIYLWVEISNFIFKFSQTTEWCSKEKKTAKTRAKETKIFPSKRWWQSRQSR